jgi:hypothetical protein
MKKSRFAGELNEIEMLPPVKIETEDLTTEEQKRKNARFKAIMAGTYVEGKDDK